MTEDDHPQRAGSITARSRRDPLATARDVLACIRDVLLIIVLGGVLLVGGSIVNAVGDADPEPTTGRTSTPAPGKTCWGNSC